MSHVYVQPTHSSIFLFQFGAAMKPHKLMWIYKHYEQLYLAFDLLLQHHYLSKYGMFMNAQVEWPTAPDASFAENFYGMKRVRRSAEGANVDKWRSLAVLVGVPYLRRKLDALYDDLKQRSEAGGCPPPTTLRQRVEQIFVQYYSHLMSAIELSQLMLQLGYVFSRSSVHSPWLLFADAKLVHLTPADHARFGQRMPPSWPTGGGVLAQLAWLLRAFPRAFIAGIVKLLGIGLFFVQFLEWWNTSELQQPTLPAAAPPKLRQVRFGIFITYSHGRWCLGVQTKAMC
jgi:peroxin-12